MCKPECVCGYEMHPRIKKKKKKRLTNDAAWPLWCISLSVNWFYLWSLLHWSLLCTWFSFSKHEVVILNSLGNHLLYDTYLQTILHIFMLRVHRRYNENQEARSSCGVCVCVCVWQKHGWPCCRTRAHSFSVTMHCCPLLDQQPITSL